MRGTVRLTRWPVAFIATASRPHRAPARPGDERQGTFIATSGTSSPAHVGGRG